MPGRVVYSNRLEELYEALKQALFLSGLGPFDERIVVVETPAMRHWLQLKAALDPEIGVCCGINFQFVGSLTAKLGFGPPSKLEVALSLEKAIRQGVAVGDAHYDKLGAYVSNDKRCVDLSYYGAELLLEGLVYGKQPMPDWLFHAAGKLNLDLQLPEQSTTPPQSIHLFGISHIPPKHLEVLQANADPVIYTLSPCMAYWADLSSDRSRAYLLSQLAKEGANRSQLDSLEALLSESHPLLANLGGVGRALASEIEDLPSSERYYLPDSMCEEYDAIPSGPPTVLTQLQGDMVTLQNPTATTDFSDDSVQIHAVATKLREIEVVRDVITTHIVDRGIKPTDVVVLAPDIGEYEPLVHAVFGVEESLPYDIGETSSSARGVLDGFMQLLQLGQSRWEASRFLALIDHPEFGYDVDESDVCQIRSWIELASIRWGYSGHHKQECLSRDYGPVDLSVKGDDVTWADGIGRLIRGLYETKDIDLSSGAEIDQLIELVTSLKSDLEPIERDQTMSVEEWITYLECLAEGYFPQFHESDLFQVFRGIRTAVAKLWTDTFSFTSIQRIIVESIQTAFYRTSRNLNVIRFGSLSQLHSLPARLVCIIGMGGEDFPRRPQFNPCRIGKPPGPSSAEIDRHAFLTALIASRETLVITYANVNATDGFAQAPNLLTAELIEYLERTVTIDGKSFSVKRVYTHHAMSYDETSFTHPIDYARACRLRAGDGVKVTFPEHTGDVTDVAVPKLVHLSELRSFASDPIRFFLKQALGLKMPEEATYQDDEPWVLDPLEVYNRSWAEILGRQSELQRADPLLKEAADRAVSKRVTALQAQFEKFGITTIQDLHFVSGCDSFERHGSIWIAPPIRVNDPQLGEIEVVGCLPRLSNQALLVSGGNAQATAIRHWPYLLALKSVENDVGCHHWLGLKGTKLLDLPAGDVHQKWVAYLSHYFKSSRTVCPLLPDWTEEVLKGDGKGLLSAIKRDLDPRGMAYPGDHLSLVLDADKVEVDQIIAAWEPTLRGVFE